MPSFTFVSTRTPPDWRRCLAALALLAAPLLATAQQQDPPDRVLYISAQQGTARMLTGGANWSAASVNWPIVNGAQVSTDPGARLELDGGWVVLRTAGPSDMGVTQLDNQNTQVALTNGGMSVRVRQLQPGERVEIDTPQAALVANQAGDFRVDVDPVSATSRVTVQSGTVTVYGAGGEATAVGARQAITFAGRDLAVVARTGLPPRDGLDQWVAAREGQLQTSVTYQYVSPAIPGIALLDQHGQWAQDPTYGAVWYPQVVEADWAPYRYGRWRWVEPWGWTWVDDAPWGFAPSHYGRWAQIGPRWAWVPGPRVARPVYAPALVGFVGGGSGGSWGISVGGALPAAAWFPLAPGEVWQPHYYASAVYVRRLNPWVAMQAPVRPPDSFYFQRRPTAVSFAPPGDFGWRGDRGPDHRPRFVDGSRLPPGVLEAARPIAPPPRGFAPGQPTPIAPPVGRPERMALPAAAHMPQPLINPAHPGGPNNAAAPGRGFDPVAAQLRPAAQGLPDAAGRPGGAVAPAARRPDGRPGGDVGRPADGWMQEHGPNPRAPGASGAGNAQGNRPMPNGFDRDPARMPQPVANLPAPQRPISAQPAPAQPRPPMHAPESAPAQGQPGHHDAAAPAWPQRRPEMAVPQQIQPAMQQPQMQRPPQGHAGDATPWQRGDRPPRAQFEPAPQRQAAPQPMERPHFDQRRPPDGMPMTHGPAETMRPPPQRPMQQPNAGGRPEQGQRPPHPPREQHERREEPRG